MSNKKNEVTVKDVRDAIAKLKRRKSVKINITVISKEIGCSRNVLYNKSELRESLKPYMKINNSKVEMKVKYGTAEYYKQALGKRNDECDELYNKLKLAMAKIIDNEVLMNRIVMLEEECKRLNDNSHRVRELEVENRKLREKLLTIGYMKL